MELFDIQNKNALITGASQGLGLEIAKGFARVGANLILVSRHMPDKYLNELKAEGISVDYYSFDLSNTKEIPQLVTNVLTKHGSVDILVNNAGTQRRNDSINFSDEDWDWVHNINEKSVFIMCREIGRYMITWGKKCKIINIASLLSFQGGYRVPAYAAAKGAVVQFTKSLSNEWASKGINVNCIAPGYFTTEMNEALINDPERNKQISIRIPAGRWGVPEDIVGTAIYLASAASDYVNGIVIPVDGGWLGR